MREDRLPWEPGGCGRLAACHHRILRHRRRRRRVGLCRSSSGRRSRFCAQAGAACVRSPAGSSGRPPPYPASGASGAATRGGGLEHRATTARWHADRSARRPKPLRLAVSARLRDPVRDRLAGRIAAPGGKDIRGPGVAWKGRRAGRRQDRRWAKAWSPEQIANRLRLDVPEHETMRVSHEATCRSSCVQGRGAAPSAGSTCVPAHGARGRCACRGRASKAAASRS